MTTHDMIHVRCSKEFEVLYASRLAIGIPCQPNLMHACGRKYSLVRVLTTLPDLRIHG